MYNYLCEICYTSHMKISRIVWGVIAVLVIVLVYFASGKQEKITEPETTAVATPTETPRLDCTDLKNYNQCYGKKDNGKGA